MQLISLFHFTLFLLTTLSCIHSDMPYISMKAILHSSIVTDIYDRLMLSLFSWQTYEIQFALIFIAIHAVKFVVHFISRDAKSRFISATQIFSCRFKRCS